LFVSGTKDPFGSPAELQAALELVPGRHELRLVENAGHDLKRPAFDWGAIVPEMVRMISGS
jgi:hypothetical protein